MCNMNASQKARPPHLLVDINTLCAHTNTDNIYTKLDISIHLYSLSTQNRQNISTDSSLCVSCGGYQMNFWVEFQKHVGSPIYGVQDYPECIFLTDQMADTAIEPWDHGTRWAMAGTCARVPSCVSACAVRRVPRAGDLITLSRGDYWLQTPADSCFLARQWAKILTKSPVTISSLATLGGGPGHKMWSRTMNEWMKQIKCMQRL